MRKIVTSLNSDYFLLFALILLGLVLRTLDIEIRPLHNDEGVNYFFLGQIDQKGYYPYSYLNYHGPAYFYLTRLCTAIFGDGIFGLRFSSILSGLLLPVCLIPFFKRNQGLYVLIASALLMLSPTHVFFSRYAIHESFFVLVTLWLAVSVYFWWEERKPCYIYQGFAALALLVSTKETFIITLFSLFIGILLLGDYKAVFRDLRAQYAVIVKGLLGCVVSIIFIFTGAFRWSDGVHEMLLAVPQWIARNDSDFGHHKPFQYYAECLAVVEPTLEILLLVFVALIFVSFLFPLKLEKFRKDLFTQNPWVRFLFAWFVSIFLVYSLVSYKTPWLILNLSLPLILLISYFLTYLVSAESLKVRVVSFAVGIAALLSTVGSSFYFNFDHPYGIKNPYSYVHTADGMLRLLDDIAVLAKQKPNLNILVGIKQYWPLPYYLRRYEPNVGYKDISNPNTISDRYDVLILDKNVLWNKSGWRDKYYRLSDVQESRTYFKLH